MGDDNQNNHTGTTSRQEVGMRDDNQNNHTDGIGMGGENPSLPAWEEELRKREGIKHASEMPSYSKFQKLMAGKEGSRFIDGNMPKALVNAGLMEAVRYYFCESKSQVYAAWAFGRGMVGNPGILHGGATAFALDETYGVLYGSLRVGPGFTANLNINYKRPVPAGQTVLIVVDLVRREGRKIFMEALMRDSLDGPVYAESSALYVIASKPS